MYWLCRIAVASCKLYIRRKIPAQFPSREHEQCWAIRGLLHFVLWHSVQAGKAAQAQTSLTQVLTIEACSFYYSYRDIWRVFPSSLYFFSISPCPDAWWEDNPSSPTVLSLQTRVWLAIWQLFTSQHPTCDLSIVHTSYPVVQVPQQIIHSSYPSDAVRDIQNWFSKCLEEQKICSSAFH